MSTEIFVIILFATTLFIMFSGTRVQGPRILYPEFLYPLMFFIYSQVYVVYLLIGGLNVRGYSADELNFLVMSALIFVICFSIGCAIASIFTNTQSKPEIRSSRINLSNLLILFFFISFLCLYSLSFLFAEHNKILRNEQGGSLFISFHGPSLFFFFLYLMRRNKFPWFIVVIYLSIGLLGALVLGERDHIMFPVFVILACLYRKKNITFIKSLIFSITGICLLFILGVIRQAQYGGNRSLSNLMGILEQNEFISVGRNFLRVVNDLQGYEHTLLNGIPALFGFDLMTGSSWFSENYYARKGFGLISELYLNGGWLAIAFVGLLLGLVLKSLYLKALQSDIIFVSYIMLLLGALFAIRQDISSLYSAGFKRVLIPILTIVIIQKLMPKKNLKLVR